MSETQTLSNVVREYYEKTPSLTFKTGDNTDVRLWFVFAEVLDFCCARKNTRSMVDVSRDISRDIKSYFDSLSSLNELEKRLFYEELISYFGGKRIVGSNGEVLNMEYKGPHPPLHYQITTRIEKLREIQTCVLSAKSHPKQTTKAYFRKEYFIINDFANKEFIKRFEELTHFKVRLDTLSEQTRKPLRERTISRLINGAVIEEYLVDLILHKEAFGISGSNGGCRYELNVKKDSSQCRTDFPTNALHLGGEFHIEIYRSEGYK